MKGTVLITGATSGIGKACAEIFAKNGFDLIITGRRTERLVAIKEHLEKEYYIACTTLAFDVQDKLAVFSAIENITTEAAKITVLINNAGLALGRANFEEGDLADWETMIDTNVKGLLYVSKAIVPYFIKNQNGHIINVGSIAGKEVYAQGNVYCASKHAVDAISKSQRIDLLEHGIKVTSIHPGAVESEFSLVRYKGNEAAAKAVYKGFTPLFPIEVAEVIYYCATLPKSVCINDLTITCQQQANSFYIFKK
jgi:3-hydroxy acid dehydrogenase / malonic semialdehyde reductase